MHRLRFAPLLVLALATAAAPARAQEGEKGAEKEKVTSVDSTVAPELRFPPFSTRFKVLAVGVGLTGVAWGITFAASRGWPEQQCSIIFNQSFVPGTGINGKPGVQCSSGPPGSAQLGIPIVGPWIALGKSGCPSDEPGCPAGKPIARGIAYVVDGVVQLAGLGLIIEALVMKTESAADPAKKSSMLKMHYRGVELLPTPVITPTMSGFGVTGTF